MPVILSLSLVADFTVNFNNDTIIEKGASACLLCYYNFNNDIDGINNNVQWYRGDSLISDSNVTNSCDCSLGELNKQLLCFSNVAESALGSNYSCRVPIGMGQVDICPFAVRFAGKYIYVYVHSCYNTAWYIVWYTQHSVSNIGCLMYMDSKHLFRV